jgi:hypothetical protein
VKKQLVLSVFIVCCLLTGTPGFALNNLIENGSFDHPDGPLTGWVIDYRFDNNNQYMENQEKVSVVPIEKGFNNVCRIESATDAGTKVETIPIPFEEGYKYRCTMKVKGPDYRIYFAGYKFKPGVKPHENPERSELRHVYKSNAETGKATNWKTVTLELPGKKITKGMKSYLKQIKYISLFVYITRTGFIDEVVITRKRDPSVTFK